MNGDTGTVDDVLAQTAPPQLLRDPWSLQRRGGCAWNSMLASGQSQDPLRSRAPRTAESIRQARRPWSSPALPARQPPARHHGHARGDRHPGPASVTPGNVEFVQVVCSMTITRGASPPSSMPTGAATGLEGARRLAAGHAATGRSSEPFSSAGSTGGPPCSFTSSRAAARSPAWDWASFPPSSSSSPTWERPARRGGDHRVARAVVTSVADVLPLPLGSRWVNVAESTGRRFSASPRRWAAWGCSSGGILDASLRFPPRLDYPELKRNLYKMAVKWVPIVDRHRALHRRHHGHPGRAAREAARRRGARSAGAQASARCARSRRCSRR